MSIWALVAVILLNGQPVTHTWLIDSQEHCEAAKAELTKEVLTDNGALVGQIQCVEFKMGTLT